MGLYKLSQHSADLSFKIPEEEKNEAKTAINQLNILLKKLDGLDKYLDLIYGPFSNHDQISEESVLKYRGFLIRYKKKMLELFKDTSKSVLLSIKYMKPFSNDTHMSELIKSLIDSFGDINDQIEILKKVLDDFKNNDFKNNLLNVIQNIKKARSQTEKLISDRIINFINTNILAINWVDNLSKEFKFDIPEKEPYLQQLYKERENKLNSLLNAGQK